MRAEAKARRAEQMGDKNPEFDWLRRDASELQWRERMRREWAVDDQKKLNALLIDRGVVSEGEDEYARTAARTAAAAAEAIAHTHTQNWHARAPGRGRPPSHVRTLPPRPLVALRAMPAFHATA